MSEYYNPHRTRNLFNPDDGKPFKLSRSKIDAFLECPRCFYLDRRLGVARPPGFPFTLNSAVDTLLKKEFDGYRERGVKHPLMEKYKVDAIPAKHPDLGTWRENFKGIQFHHKPTHLLITGAIDDVWINPIHSARQGLARWLQAADGNIPVAIPAKRVPCFRHRVFCLRQWACQPRWI